MHTCSVCGARHRSWLGVDGCLARHRYAQRARASRADAPVPAPPVRQRQPVADESAPALTAR